jgi:hypothetical protein
MICHIFHAFPCPSLPAFPPPIDLLSLAGTYYA